MDKIKVTTNVADGEQDTTVSISEASKFPKEKARAREIKAMRTHNRNVYEMNDGTKQLVLYPAAVNAYDKANKTFNEVDTTLTIEDDGKHYRNSNNRFTARFNNEDTGVELFTIEDGIYAVRVSEKKAGRTSHMRTAPKYRIKNNPEDISDTLVFGNINDNVDYEYSVNGNGVKENIIIKRKMDNYRYLFELACTNVTAEYDELSNSVIFFDPNDNSEVFYIPAPFMLDAAGAVSTNVSYEMTQIAADKIELAVIANEAWINASARVFPVTIDPQIVRNTKNAFGSYSYTNGSLAAGALPPVGVLVEGSTTQIGRMYISLDTLDIPANIKVKSATLKIYQFSDVISSTGTLPKLCICDALGATLATGTTIADTLGSVLDYEQIKLAANADGETISYTFDITQFVNGAVNNNLAQSSLAVKFLDENYTASNYVMLYGSAGFKNYPEITIDYETDYAVNASAPVHTHEIGRFGTGMIDLKYGNLMLEGEDFAWAGNKMPVTIKHLYNGFLAGYQYTNNSSLELHTADFSAMNIGLGWRLNIMQSMIPHTFTHDGVTYNGYVYVDETGAETCFKPGTAGYEDVNGMGMVYFSGEKTITNGNEKYVFDDVGRLIHIDNVTKIGNGLFDETEITNTMSITYDVNDRISNVTDGAGREFAFAFSDEGNLLSITPPDGNAISYTYNSSGYLTAINYPGNRQAKFTRSSGMISRVDICDENSNYLYRIFYTYSNGNVKSVDERGVRYIDGGIAYDYGAHSEYEYSLGTNRTKVITTEKADTDSGETEDNIINTVYTFDADGNISSRYVYTGTSDNLGVDGDVGGIHPHGAEGGVDLANNIVNILSVANLAEWDNISAPSTDYTFEDKDANGYAPFGTNYLKMNSHFTSGVEVGKYTTESLTAGEYTFSAYLKVSYNAISGTENPGAYLRVTDTSGNIIAQSERIYRTEWEYTRLAVPFVLTAAKTVKLEVVINGKGIVNADAPQLENKPYAGAYNMVKDGSFKNGLTDWIIYDSSDNDTTISTDAFTLGHAAKIVGNINLKKSIEQPITRPTPKSTRETFTLSAWAKGEGLIKKTRTGFNDPEFRLRAAIVYDDEDFTTEEYTADFAPCTTDWQFISLRFEKTRYQPVAGIIVSCEYNYNLGSALFDNISLVRDSIEEDLDESDFVSYTYSEETTETTETAAEEEPNNAYDNFEEAYDAYGNPLTETTFTNGEFGTLYRSFEYSLGTEDNAALAGNDLTCEYDARGNKTEYEVDPMSSRVTKVTDREGNITAYEYDTSGRTTKVTSKKPNNDVLATVDYAYDEFDNLTAITRGDEMGYSLAYNTYHRLESIGVAGRTNPLATYTYKAGNGRLKQITYANGDYMQATYNSLGQLITEKWFDSSDVLTAHYKYAYDHNGNIVRSIDILANIEYNYIYEDGRITRAAQSTITMSGENVTSKTLDFAIHYVYDKDGKLIVKYTSDDATLADGNYYEYDKNDGTVVLRREDGKTIIAHSKTDSFGRKEFDELQLGTGFVSRKFSYHAGEKNNVHVENGKLRSTPTTNLVSEIVMSDGHVLSYEYDAEERITKVVDTDTIANTSKVIEYIYNALGQLFAEEHDSFAINTMLYDNYGNITEKNGRSYTYDDTWKDLLIAYNGQTITYDAQGNPTSYLGHTLTWEKGRQLKSYDTNTYTYNANGIRTSKTVGGVKHTYILDGSKILRETWGDNVLTTLWDNEDSLCGIRYADESYFFLKNLQGDIIAITDKDGAVVARYIYDAWGEPGIISDTSAVGIATINPFRYRGYYYDGETQLYYLQSRYYNPVVGRFVNVDEATYIGVCGVLPRNNLFSYCDNAPIARVDLGGDFWISLIVAGVALAYLGNNLIHYTYNASQTISGYIYNQTKGVVATMPFGFFKSSHNGCGWIATYNAALMLGKRVEPVDIISEYELTGAILCGVFGIQPYAITNFFRNRGYKVTTTYNSRKFDEVAKKNTANIIFYWHGSGAHYVAFNWDGTNFIGYNTYSNSEGPDNFGTSFYNWLQKRYNSIILISISAK